MLAQGIVDLEVIESNDVIRIEEQIQKGSVFYNLTNGK